MDNIISKMSSIMSSLCLGTVHLPIMRIISPNTPHYMEYREVGKPQPNNPGWVCAGAGWWLIGTIHNDINTPRNYNFLHCCRVWSSEAGGNNETCPVGSEMPKSRTSLFFNWSHAKLHPHFDDQGLARRNRNPIIWMFRCFVLYPCFSWISYSSTI